MQGAKVNRQARGKHHGPPDVDKEAGPGDSLDPQFGRGLSANGEVAISQVSAGTSLKSRAESFFGCFVVYRFEFIRKTWVLIEKTVGKEIVVN